MANAGNTHCRQCGEGVETGRHIHSQCCPKGFNLYMKWHDCVLLVVYYSLCKHYGFEVTPRWWELEPLPIRENQHTIIHWDIPIPTDQDIVARRPDVSLQDKKTRWLYLIEMAVAWDSLQVEIEPRCSPSMGNFVPTWEDSSLVTVWTLCQCLLGTWVRSLTIWWEA